MLKLKIYEFIITEIITPVCGFFGTLLEKGHWAAAIGIVIVVPTIIGCLIDAVISKFKRKR